MPLTGWTGAVLVLLMVACSSSLPVTTPQALPTSTLVVAQPAPTSTSVPVVLEPRTPTGEYYRGQPTAPVTVQMFGDFQCPACGEFARTVEPAFIERYVDTGKVKFVWRDYAWIGDESFSAAQAARCAGKQGHFWEYHNYLYAHQRGENLGQFSSDNLDLFARSVGLEPISFDACLATRPDMTSIQDAVRSGVAAGVDVTPSFLVNDELRVGAPPLNRLSALMEYYLVRAPH